MAETLIPPGRALLSVHDKTGIVDLARALNARGCELVSTGGTAVALRNAGLGVREVSELTGFPEMMDGRVKTLHPRVHGGLLARRDSSEDLEQAAGQGIETIDLVVVTLYPFEEVSRRPDAGLEDLVENIDIGGPAMLRSAAKNHEFVAVLCDTADYAGLLEQLEEGGTGLEFRRRMAAKVFARTAAYDGLIAATLAGRHERKAGEGVEPSKDRRPAPYVSVTLPRARELRYGENPHQEAAVYGGLEGIEVLHGKELSYNNLLDVDAALELLRDFSGPSEAFCAILKHTNPCGAALAPDPVRAFELAFATDTVSPFGGILVWNRELDETLARAVHGIFTEILIAPGYSPEALALLKKKKQRRLLRCDTDAGRLPLFQQRQFFGGLLVQEFDSLEGDDPAAFRCVTKRRPGEAELNDLLFGWKIVRHVKSNAIVLAGEGRTLGIGAGQMSRVDASELAVSKARKEGHRIEGSVLASDAFFPFPDGVEAAAGAGVRAVIQPGGSVRDREVIEAADRCGLSMLFTGRRHFRH